MTFVCNLNLLDLREQMEQALHEIENPSSSYLGVLREWHKSLLRVDMTIGVNKKVNISNPVQCLYLSKRKIRIESICKIRPLSRM
jgi:hypothetical protein